MEGKLAWQCTEPECERPKEGNTDFCSSHNAIARKSLRDSITATQKKDRQKAAQVEKSREKRKKIAQVSDKRQLQLIVYDKLKGPWLKDKICEVCQASPACDVHHRKGREGELLLKVEFWLAACRPCHTEITKNSAEAIANGYSLPRNQIIQDET